MGFFPKGLKNEFETAVVNEPSVFEPLKVYCIRRSLILFLPISRWEWEASLCVITPRCVFMYEIASISKYYLKNALNMENANIN